jgi:uncharacterized membrane protein
MTSDETHPLFKELINPDMIHVFLPTTPNPTSGFFLMVPRAEAIILDIPVDEALKLVISGGSTVHPNNSSLLDNNSK